MEEFSPFKIRHSLKRKKIRQSASSSSHLIGMLTRSKSRIYSHQNRSGISRPDPVPREPKSYLAETEPVEVLLDLNCNSASRISSIKDLRTRRIFTHDVNSVHEEEEAVEDETEDRKKLLKGSDSSRISNSKFGDANFDELEKSEIMVSKKEDARNYFENGLSLKDQKIPGNGFNSKSKMALTRCRRRKIFKTSSSFSYKRLLPYLMGIVNDDSSVTEIEIVDATTPCKLQKLDGVKSEMMSFAGKSYTSKAQCVGPQSDDTKSTKNEDVQKLHKELGQTTPPEVEQKEGKSDADIVDFSVGKECVQVTPDPAISTNTEVGHGGEPIETKIVLGGKQYLRSSEKSNRDISRQSPSSKHDSNSINRSVLNPRSLLFNNPRSLSYRRLLPFLINVPQTNSCDSHITQDYPKPQVDTEKDYAENDYVNETTTKNFYEKQLTEDRARNHPSPSDGSSPEANNKLVSSTALSSSIKYLSNGGPSLVTSETLPELLMTERMPQSHSDHRKSEPCSGRKDNCIESPPSSTINNDILNKQSASKELGFAGKQRNCLDMEFELRNNREDPTFKFDMNRSSFQAEASDATASSTKGPFRGILKRNRRGCRGLCTCLNCASFRLHADRAFEFSRKQMHEAEEIASDLMKELANLRFLLAKSIISDNDLAAIQLNRVLIKEACNRALEAENLAKERLSQLNYDLNVHRRIPTLLEPKVTFANYIQERVIPLSDSLAGPEKRGMLYEEL
ncbi:hypothetical protein OROMI_006181 [Orobanche minor]